MAIVLRNESYPDEECVINEAFREWKSAARFRKYLCYFDSSIIIIQLDSNEWCLISLSIGDEEESKM